MVVRASGFDPEGAAAWLIERLYTPEELIPAPSLPLRARFSPQSLAELERQSEREKYRAQYPSMFFTAAEQLNQCLWFCPGKALARGACPESGLTLAQVEWHAEELQATLKREFPQQKPSGAVRTDRRGVSGAPGKYPWHALGAAFGAWLHEKPGRAGLDERDHLDALAALAAELECEIPPRTTAQRYLHLWLEGYMALDRLLSSRQ
jgi:hypothetical protein